MQSTITRILGVVVVALAVYGLYQLGSGTFSLMAKPGPLELKAYAEMKAGRVVFKKDEHDHDKKVEAGQRVQWTVICTGCPDDARLEIENIEHKAILDLLDNAEKAKVKKQAKDGVAIIPNYKGNADKVYKVAAAFPSKLVRVSPTVVQSRGYIPFGHEHLWKFDWVIKQAGKELARWDPHFAGGRNKR